MGYRAYRTNYATQALFSRARPRLCRSGWGRATGFLTGLSRAEARLPSCGRTGPSALSQRRVRYESARGPTFQLSGRTARVNLCVQWAAPGGVQEIARRVREQPDSVRL